MRKTDHIVVSMQTASLADVQQGRCRLQAQGASLKCQHCGEVFPMPNGPITWVRGVCEAFIAAHKFCRNRNADQQV